MSGMLTSDYGDTAAALGGPAIPTPLGYVPASRMPKSDTPSVSDDPALDPEVRKRLLPKLSQNPTSGEIEVAAPKNSETNLTIARRQREMGENPSGDPSAKNPFSSAGGPDQIIDSTWVDLMKKYHPERVQGQSREQIIAMKYDPANVGMSHELATKYDEENARFLASNRIPPTPNNINLAYRAGPEGAKAIIMAAQTNPNALVKDVVPAMGTPGNNGAGNMTVGQIMANPYGRGPGGAEESDPRSRYVGAQGNAILAQMLADQEAGKARVAKLDRDYKPIEVPERPKPPDTDPLATFGTLAGVFATLAAGFSRTPAIAAMNGLAGAIHGAKEHDWELYKAQYDQFKTMSEYAFKAHDQHSADIRDALEMMSKNMAAGTAMMNATIALSQDDEMKKLHDRQKYVEMWKLQEERNKNKQETERKYPETLAALKLTAALENLKYQQEHGTPEQIEEATRVVREVQAERAETVRSGLGGFKTTGSLTAQEELRMMAEFDKQNPGASIDERAAYWNRLKGREDPDRKTDLRERELSRKERLDKLNADHRARMADIAEDRNISTVERDRRLAEERERHDRATEALTEKKIETGAEIAREQISSREKIATDRWKAQQLAQEGSLKAERRDRFEEIKSKMPEGTPASAIWDQVDRQILEAKAPPISEFGLRSAAERFIAGDKTALQGFGRNPVLFGKIESEIAKVAQERGISGTELTRIQQDYQVATKALKDFATGKQGQTAQALNVVTQHLGLLSDAAKALATNDSRTINRLENAFKNEFGWDEPITFNAIKTIVGSEVEKAVAGSNGAVEDRRDLRQGLAADATPGQLASVIEGYKGLMAGQLQGLEKTYERSTHRADFRDEFLLPEAKREMDRIAPRGGQSATPQSSGPKDGDTAMSKSGKPIIYRNGKWEYSDAGSR